MLGMLGTSGLLQKVCCSASCHLGLSGNAGKSSCSPQGDPEGARTEIQRLNAPQITKVVLSLERFRRRLRAVAIPQICDSYTCNFGVECRHNRAALLELIFVSNRSEVCMHCLTHSGRREVDIVLFLT